MKWTELRTLYQQKKFDELESFVAQCQSDETIDEETTQQMFAAMILLRARLEFRSKSKTINLSERHLITLGKDICDDTCAQVWHYVAMSGNWPLLEFGIKHGHFDPSTYRDNHGSTIVHYLALFGSYADFAAAMNSELFPAKTLRNKKGAYAWHYLGLRGDYAALQQAESAFGLKLLEITDNHGANPYHYLASSGNYLELMRAVKAQSLDLFNSQDNRERSLIHYFAVAAKDLVFCQAVLDLKFDPTEPEENSILQHCPKQFKKCWLEWKQHSLSDIQAVLLRLENGWCIPYTDLRVGLHKAEQQQNRPMIAFYRECLKVFLKTLLARKAISSFIPLQISLLPSEDFLIEWLHTEDVDTAELRHMIHLLIKEQPSAVRLIESLNLVLREREKQATAPIADRKYMQNFIWLWHKRSDACESFDHMWKDEIAELNTKATQIQAVFRGHALRSVAS